MQAADFWQNRERAQSVVARARDLKRQVAPVLEVARRLEDLAFLAGMTDEGGSTADVAAVEKDLAAATADLGRIETRAMFRGEHDHLPAFLQVQAGAGGTDASDWAEMLLKMYLRWAERLGFPAEVVDRSEAEEAGIRNATVRIEGEYAYGRLKAEIGVHRLVRISPFDAARRRQTSFAAVDVYPDVPEEEVDVKDSDLRVDTFSASGPGGQHVNKTMSAVRLTHLPTGIVVSCQNERSQLRNRKTAMKMLVARLAQRREAELDAQMAKAYQAKGEIAWANQIRSYTLQPYTLVKDHRTDFEMGNATAVLEGQIDGFIEAWLKQAAAKPKAKGG